MPVFQVHVCCTYLLYAYLLNTCRPAYWAPIAWVEFECFFATYRVSNGSLLTNTQHMHIGYNKMPNRSPSYTKKFVKKMTYRFPSVTNICTFDAHQLLISCRSAAIELPSAPIRCQERKTATVISTDRLSKHILWLQPTSHCVFGGRDILKVKYMCSLFMEATARLSCTREFFAGHTIRIRDFSADQRRN